MLRRPVIRLGEMLGAPPSGGGGGPPPALTWDPAATSGMTLSPDQKTATVSPNYGYNPSGSLQTFTSDIFAEADITGCSMFSNDGCLGIVDSVWNNNGGGGLWSDNHGAGWWGDGNIYANGGGLASIGSWGGAGATIGIYFKPLSLLAWWRFNGGAWNGSGTADPKTNTGGIDLSSALVGGGPFRIGLNLKPVGAFAVLRGPLTLP